MLVKKDTKVFKLLDPFKGSVFKEDVKMRGVLFGPQIGNLGFVGRDCEANIVELRLNTI